MRVCGLLWPSGELRVSGLWGSTQPTVPRVRRVAFRSEDCAGRFALCQAVRGSSLAPTPHRRLRVGARVVSGSPRAPASRGRGQRGRSLFCGAGASWQ
eukprot:15460248-Alexandrium_andersonii.AAC.1